MAESVIGAQAPSSGASLQPPFWRPGDGGAPLARARRATLSELVEAFKVGGWRLSARPPLDLLSCGVAPDAEAVQGVAIADGRRGTAQQARTWSVSSTRVL